MPPVIIEEVHLSFSILPPMVAFDLIGFGTRIQEAKHFYDRYPHWSKMGDMVTNVRNMISDARQRMPFVDGQIFIWLGIPLGGAWLY